MHMIEWCEWGLQLADTAIKNVGENELNHIMKYNMVRIDNWQITLVQEDTGFRIFHGARVLYN